MLVKVIKKATFIKNLNIERTLPTNGTVTSRKGDKVEPFTKLGMAKYSYGLMRIDSSLRLAKGKQEDKYILKQEERDFWLLAGVWGEVQSVVENRSVLVKSQCMDLALLASTDFSYSG